MSDETRQINELVRLSDNVFQGPAAFSLMANLKNVRDEDWNTAPPGGNRTIADILGHVGAAKWLYQDHAFGPGTLKLDPPPLDDSGKVISPPREEMLNWLKEAHQAWIAGLNALANDSELDRDRTVFWGGTLPTRVIVHIVIAHDTYHAGEINHIRALLQKNDHWD